MYGMEVSGQSGIHHDGEKNPENIYFGDPYVLVDDGTYYVYGTGRQSDIGIEVYKSEDLRNWKGPVGEKDGFALHQEDVYGDHFFWAPEVYRIRDKYYMFFSVEEHMAIAESDNPQGPFTQNTPSLLTDFNAIDHHLFTDDDGIHYIYFAKFEEGLEIWAAEINVNPFSIKEETMTRLLWQSQEWEKSPKEPIGIVNEGPFVVKKKDMYYMIYSANHYASPDYGIGLAYAEHPLGPWKKDEGNPVLQNPGELSGTGHSSLFEDLHGNLHMIYHAHNSKEEVHPRKVFYNPVEFVDAENGERYTLRVIPERHEVKPD